MTNREEVKGALNKAIGTVKEKVGRATGNRDLEEEGAADHTVGSVQAGVGKAARKVSDAIEDVADDLKRP